MEAFAGQVGALRRSRAREVVPLVAAAAIAATVVGGLAASALGARLGTPLPPFFATWDPRATWAAVGVIAAAPLFALGAARLRSASLGPVAFAASAFGLALGLRLAVGAAREGASGWHSVFGIDPEAGNEYLPALSALEPGAGVFLDRFAEVAPTLPIHPSAHPPGLLLLLDGLGVTGPRGMAALTIVGGTLVVPLVYVLGRRLLDERRARVATLLFVFAPSAVLYGVTSADALFVTVGLVAACALVARRPVARALAPLALAIAAFASYALLAVAAWAALVVVRRRGIGAAARAVIIWTVGTVVAYGVLHLLTGFDPIGAAAAAGDAYDLGISRARPYAYWVLGSPAVFLVALGLPIAWYALRAMAAGEALAVALAAVLVIAAVLGFSKGETERIWLFLVPLACLAAASALPDRKLTLVIAFLLGQTLATELLLDTVW